jgi:hypothetical protein
LTTIVSAPPAAPNATRSTSSRSVVMLATLRKKRTRGPLAETSTVSDAPLPLKSSTSVPASPSTVSFPSPGFHTKLSAPLPSRATSSPRLPATTSFPLPPSRVSGPKPPVSVSAPAPPSIVTASSENRPVLLSIRTSSAPPPAATSIAVKVPRSKVRSAVPSAPTSASRMFGTPGWRRSTSLSLAELPVSFSVPACTCPV